MSSAPAARSSGASRPSRRTAAGALVLVLTLGACADDSGAAKTSTPTPSATVAPTPSSSPMPTRDPEPTPTQDSAPDFDAIDLKTPPPRPSALDEPPSEEGAEAVARYFVLLYAYASATYDLEEFNELGYGDCGFCNRAAKDFAKYKADGTKVEGGAIVVHDAEASLLSNDYCIVAMTLSQEASREVTASGKVLEDSEGFLSKRFEVDVKWYDGAWLVMAVNN